ncbi:hypothetical protein K491DRAFT_405342 [Lophiostoma macrostomum CBS 122681]|uniref:Uncharacterized protein n=1 Tax=Lophiostoma macrostomum CBS 122681 TaxID=1314788 RepID=A0A6A6T817_9PLEO|nr:hypothetical protein K491DRAFT_405342 [Lophiostoma macrostomum CBS 122681]
MASTEISRVPADVIPDSQDSMDSNLDFEQNTAADSPRGTRRKRPLDDDDGHDSGDQDSDSHKHQRVKVESDDVPQIILQFLSEIVELPSAKAALVPQARSRPSGSLLSTVKTGFVNLVIRDNVEPTIILNPNGETTLIIAMPAKDGKEPKFEHVECAHASLLEAASSDEWRHMMEERKVLVPTVDDSQGILFMVRVAHRMDLTDVYPKTFDFEGIVRIASMIHKYNASSKVRQELVKRIPAIFKKSPQYFIDKPKREEWLFVAWVLGFEESFAALLRHLIRHSSVDDAGNLLDKNKRIICGLFPEVVAEHIGATRKMYLRRLLEAAYSYLEFLSSDQNARCSHPQGNANDNCASLMCGSFMIGLRSMGLDQTKPHEDNVAFSVCDLELHLKHIKGHQPQASQADWDDFSDEVKGVHPSCQNKTFWSWKVYEKMRGIDEVPENFSQYLALQKGKWAN